MNKERTKWSSFVGDVTHTTQTLFSGYVMMCLLCVLLETCGTTRSRATVQRLGCANRLTFWHHCLQIIRPQLTHVSLIHQQALLASSPASTSATAVCRLLIQCGKEREAEAIFLEKKTDAVGSIGFPSNCSDF